MLCQKSEGDGSCKPIARVAIKANSTMGTQNIPFPKRLNPSLRSYPTEKRTIEQRKDCRALVLSGDIPNSLAVLPTQEAIKNAGKKKLRNEV